jgi:hypothetical protein
VSAENKVNGSLAICVYADCPKCQALIDLCELEEMTEEGYIYSLIMKDRFRNDRDSWKDIGCEFECPSCAEKLILDELMW